MKRTGQFVGQPTIRKFSDITSSRKLMGMMVKSSRSKVDLDQRLGAYSKAFSNLYDGMASHSQTRKFTHNGGTGLGQLSGLAPAQFIDVTVATMIKSIAGLFAVERGLDAPQAVLPFVNTVSTHNGDLVSPNIGPDLKLVGNDMVSTNLKSGKFSHRDDAASGDTYQVVTGSPLVPGTLEIVVTKGNGDTFKIIDDSKGNLLAAASAGMTVGTINYTLGDINFEFAAALGQGGKWTLEVNKDYPTSPENRIKGDLDYYSLITTPEVIIYENNFITNIVAQKSMNIDMNVVLKRRVMEEYIKLVNRRIVEAIDLGYSGDTITVDLTRFDLKYNAFDTYIQLFSHGMTQVNTELTKKSWKSVETSAYLVGLRVAETFKSSAILNLFVPNKDASYIEGLIGFYNGIPVVQTQRIPENVGYAVHKTSDGQMAPLARGIFLPINDLPEVGNFNNPTQMASGIYSYEGTRLLTSELVQRFELKFPIGMDTIGDQPDINELFPTT